MTTITRDAAHELIRAEKAREVGLMTDDDGTVYVIIDRLDTQTVDHYPADDEDIPILQQAEEYAFDWGSFADCIDPRGAVYTSREQFESAPINLRIADAVAVIRANR